MGYLPGQAVVTDDMTREQPLQRAYPDKLSGLCPTCAFMVVVCAEQATT